MMGKLFGVSFAVALLLSGLAASAASAGIFFEVGAIPAAVLVEDSHDEEWTIGGHTVVCKKFTGATAATKTFSTHDLLVENVKYEECSEPAFAGRTATVTFNCKILLESESTISETRSAGSTAVTKCSGSGYQINVTSGGCIMRMGEGVSKTAEFFAGSGGDMTYSIVNESFGATYEGLLCGEGIDLNARLASYGTLSAQGTTLKLSNKP